MRSYAVRVCLGSADSTDAFACGDVLLLLQAPRSSVFSAPSEGASFFCLFRHHAAGFFLLLQGTTQQCFCSVPPGAKRQFFVLLPLQAPRSSVFSASAGTHTGHFICASFVCGAQLSYEGLT